MLDVLDRVCRIENNGQDVHNKGQNKKNREQCSAQLKENRIIVKMDKE